MSRGRMCLVWRWCTLCAIGITTFVFYSFAINNLMYDLVDISSCITHTMSVMRRFMPKPSMNDNGTFKIEWSHTTILDMSHH